MATSSRDCAFCAKEGRKAAAHRVLPSGRGACERHYEAWLSGKLGGTTTPAKPWTPPAAEEIRAEEQATARMKKANLASASRTASGPPNGKQEEGEVKKKICKCGCGEALRSDNKKGLRTGHKMPEHLADSGVSGSANGKGELYLRVAATEDAVEAEWQRWSESLPMEMKARILNQRGYKRIAVVPYKRH